MNVDCIGETARIEKERRRARRTVREEPRGDVRPTCIRIWDLPSFIHARYVPGCSFLLEDRSTCNPLAVLTNLVARLGMVSYGKKSGGCATCPLLKLPRAQ